MNTGMTVQSSIDASKALLAEVAASVRPLLPGDWTLSFTYGTQHLTRDSDGLAIYFTQGWNDRAKGRMEIVQDPRTEAWKSPVNGKYIDPTGWNESLPRIGASATKDPKRIASDIVRRLLPDAEAMHAKALERLAGSNDYHAGLEAKMEALGLPVGLDQGEPSYKARRGSYGKGPRAEVTATSTDVEISLCGLTVEQAKAILEMLPFAE